MKDYSIWFMIFAILYFVSGSLLGTLFFFDPSLLPLRPVHVHMNLLGFMSQMIFGVLYHVFPRLFGVPMYSNKLVALHFYLGNITLILLLTGMGLGYTGVSPEAFSWTKWAALGHWLSIVLFAFNIFATSATIHKHR